MSTNTANRVQHTGIRFAQSVVHACRRAGLPDPVLDPTTPHGLPENKGYVFLRWGSGSEAASLIVQKSERSAPRLDSHLDLTGHDGFIPMAKPNGRVVCHLEPDLGKVMKVIGLFVGASKRAVRVASKAASATASQEAIKSVVGATDAPLSPEDEAYLLATLGGGLATDSQQADQTGDTEYGDMTDEEMEEATQTVSNG